MPSFLFEFIVDGPPVSQQARRREQVRRWRDEVRTAIVEARSPSTPTTAPVAVTILYFYQDIAIDIDNVPKPILDAMKGLVFRDDVQVIDLRISRHRLGVALNPARFSAAVIQRLALPGEFVHISVAEAPTEEQI